MTAERRMDLDGETLTLKSEPTPQGEQVCAFNDAGQRVSAVYTISGVDLLPPDAEAVDSLLDFLEGELRRISLLKLIALEAQEADADED